MSYLKFTFDDNTTNTTTEMGGISASMNGHYNQINVIELDNNGTTLRLIIDNLKNKNIKKVEWLQDNENETKTLYSISGLITYNWVLSELDNKFQESINFVETEHL